MSKSGPRLVLASASPRRRMLLQLLVSRFEVVHARIEETTEETAPERIVVDLARRKAEAAAAAGGADGLVLGADTAVFVGEEMLGKPRDRRDAARMLALLGGRTHRVLTGLWLLDTADGRTASDCVTSEVRVRRLGAAEIERYLEVAAYADKAGAYAIQEHGAAFVEGVDGDYSNVMGLPAAATARLLAALGCPTTRAEGG